MMEMKWKESGADVINLILAACRTRRAPNCQPIEIIILFRWQKNLPVQQNQWVRG
jgi:hypothetical protein